MSLRFFVALASVWTCCCVAAGPTGVAATAERATAPVVVTPLTVSLKPETQAVAPGFVGLSIEYPGILEYSGTDQTRLDPVFEQLVKNLAPGQRPILRIGGASTDTTWAPVPGVQTPPWVAISLTPQRFAVISALARATNAEVIPSINLKANDLRIAATEAQGFRNSLPRNTLLAFEIGNEPELYGSFDWYRTPNGVRIFARPHNYNSTAFARDYSHIASALAPSPLVGPSTGGPAFTRSLPRFLAGEPRVRIVTLHRYGLDHCSGDDPVPTVARLMSSAAQRGVAQSVAFPVKVARSHHLPTRIEELNAVACGGWKGVSNTFGSALWAVETLLESVRSGVAGVNIHTRTRGLNSLFATALKNGRWEASVSPEYYGLMLFAQAVPPGSRLLHTTGGRTKARIHLWAARLPDGRIRIILINEDTRKAAVKVVAPAARGVGSLERLSAPSIHATTGVTLGGHGFGRTTTTGRLLRPPSLTVRRLDRGTYAVSLPAASAATLTLR